MQTLTPSLLSKLGTIAQIVDEASDCTPLDLQHARSLLADREVSQWLDGMHKQGLLNADQMMERAL